MGTLHQLPVMSKGSSRTTTAANGLAIALREAVDTDVGAAASFEAREAATLRLSNDAAATCLQNDLQTKADEFTEFTG